jgi:hypothetical protein
MEFFARAVEIVLKDSELRDAPGFRPAASAWDVAARAAATSRLVRRSAVPTPVFA